MLEKSSEAATEPRPPLDVLRELVARLDRIAGDVRAFGPWLAREAGGIAESAAEKLGQMDELAHSLAGELEACRGRFVRGQLKALAIDDGAHGLRINLGAGARPVPGWINVDLHPAELAIDVTWGLPFAGGAARYVYTSHCLEHLYLADMLRTLREIHRVLADGGLLRLVLPDIETYARAYVAADEAFFAERRRVWYWLPDGLPPLMTLLGYAGAGARPADFTDTHKFGYDFATLEFLLRRVGFREIRRSSYMRGQDQILLLDQHSEVAGASYRGRHYSLFVEAKK